MYYKLAILVGVSAMFYQNRLNAQTPTDALMMSRGALCVDVSYEHSRFDEYWEGTLKRDNGNMGTLKRHSVMPMFNLGIVKWLNVLGTIHYVVTSPTAGQLEGAKGFSDMNFWIKAEPFRKELGSGTFNVLATAGVMFQVSDYVADYPYAIGMGCPEGSFKAIVQYRLRKGFYARAHTGYMIRGNATLQRTYYYTTQGYYTEEVDIPNAMDYAGALGYFVPNKQYRGEVIFDGMHTFGGFDIRRQDMPFPSNKIEFTRIGALFHYYPAFVPGLDIHINGGYVLTGRNIGQSATIGGGIAYVFKIWDRKKKEEGDNYERPLN